MSAPATPAASARGALWSLAFGNVVIGTGALAFTGMLVTIATDLGETHAAIGLIAGLFSLGIAVSGPPLGGITSRFERRHVLALSLALFGLGHFLSAAAAGYWSLLAIRILTSFAGTLFTPQAAATASLLVPAERRARTMSFVFLGWSIAAVLGMPAGAWFASLYGWRAAMTAIGVLSMIGALGVWIWLPAKLFVARIDRAAWRAILHHPTLLRVVSVTAIHASGQFILFSYVVVAYRDALSVDAGTISVILAVMGFAGFVGNLVAGRMADRVGPTRVLHVMLMALAVAFALWIVGFLANPGPLATVVIVVASIVWGSSNFTANSMQQVRLVNLAPSLASVSVALNTSAIYLGQFVGATIGGFILTHAFSVPPTEALPWFALPIFFVALAVSTSAQRRVQRVTAAA